MPAMMMRRRQRCVTNEHPTSAHCMRYSATLLCIPINFDLIRCSAIYCHVLQLVMVFTFTCVCVLLLILILFFCTGLFIAAFYNWKCMYV